MGQRRARTAPGSRPPPPTTPLILLVEDDRHQREMYATYLEWEGYRVITAGDGLAALTRALDVAPAVIVMDLWLRGRLDGWEVTRRLKRDRRTSHIPIIACTAHVMGDALQRALDAGCETYLMKPCLPQDLAREISGTLFRASERRRRPA